MSNLISAAVQRRVVGSATRKSVLLYMADRASDDGSGIWTSKASIARDLELSRRAVQLAVQALVGAGLMREAGERACKHGFTHEYAIDLEVLGQLASTRDPAPGLLLDARPEAASRHGSAGSSVSTRESGSPVNGIHLCKRFTCEQDSPVNQIHPNHPITTFTTTARGSDGPVDSSLQDRCLAVAGRGLCPAGRQSITVTSDVIDGWLAAGFDLELDVLPVIASRTVAMRISPIRTWAYFSDAVREAHRTRVALAARSQNAENSMVSGGSGGADRSGVGIGGSDANLRFFADWVNGDKFLPSNAVSNRMAAALLKAGLVSSQRMVERGVPFVQGGRS